MHKAQTQNTLIGVHPHARQRTPRIEATAPCHNAMFGQLRRHRMRCTPQIKRQRRCAIDRSLWTCGGPYTVEAVEFLAGAGP